MTSLFKSEIFIAVCNMIYQDLFFTLTLIRYVAYNYFQNLSLRKHGRLDLFLSTYINTGIIMTIYVCTLLFVSDDQLAIADSKTTTLREHIFMSYLMTFRPYSTISMSKIRFQLSKRTNQNSFKKFQLH